MNSNKVRMLFVLNFSKARVFPYNSACGIKGLKICWNNEEAGWISGRTSRIAMMWGGSALLCHQLRLLGQFICQFISAEECIRVSVRALFKCMRALVLAYLCDVCVSWVEGEGLQSSPCIAKLFLKVLKESLVLTTQCWKIMV